MPDKSFDNQNSNQSHASTLKKRSFKGRKVGNIKGSPEPAWFTEVRSRAADLGVRPVRGWGR
jgi:hypothetical protein